MSLPLSLARLSFGLLAFCIEAAVMQPLGLVELQGVKPSAVVTMPDVRLPKPT